MDIEHSAINQIQRTGFPNHEYIEWEMRLEREEIVEDEWPDGMSWGNWQKEKTFICDYERLNHPLW